jgi:hypothetical protein
VRTTCPTVFGYDSAELTIGASTLGLLHSPGYPLYTLLGKLFSLVPLGGIAYRTNLMSAVFGALGVAALYGCSWSLTRSRLAAAAGALAFGLGYTYWSQSVVAEVYTLQIFLVGSALTCILTWWRRRRRAWLLAAAALGGLSLTNHTSAILLLPAVLYLIWRGLRTTRASRSDWALAAGCFLAPLILYAYVPIRAAGAPSYNWPEEIGLDVRTVRGLWLHLTSASFRPSLFLSLRSGLAGGQNLVSSLGRDFAWLGVPFGILGLVRLWRAERTLFWFCLALFVPPTLVFVNYQVFDQDVFFLTPFFIWAWWMALGFASLLDAGRRRFPARRALGLAAALIVLAPALFSLAGNFPRLDFSQRTILADDCRTALASVPRDSWIFSGWTVAMPLKYFQIVEGMRSDVDIYDASFTGFRLLHDMSPQGYSLDEIVELTGAEHRRAAARELERRPVLLTYVDYDISLTYDFSEQGSLYTIRRKDPPRHLDSVRAAPPFPVVFGKDITLMAVGVSRTDLGPSDPFRITFATTLRRPTDKRYRVLVLLTRVGAHELAMANEYDPGSLEYTTDRWPPGALFEQSYDIGVPGPPDAGTYLLSVGVTDEDALLAPSEPHGIGTATVPVGYLRVTD